jgi:hypothetical protein
MPRTRTRVLRRTRPHDPEWPPARAAQLRRDIRKKMAKFTAAQAAYAAQGQRSVNQERAQEKAPGLSTGGFAQPDEPAWDDYSAYDED